jgi:hypothetical protein
MTALFKPIKAEAISGLICIVKTEFGQKPRVSLKNSANSLTSKLASDDKGFTKGMFITYLFKKGILLVNNH